MFLVLQFSIKLTMIEPKKVRFDVDEPQDQMINYKQLYLQCKRNVSIFMKHVDKELTAMLQSHQEEKKKMQREIQNLKMQIKHQNDTNVHSKVVESAQRRSNSDKKHSDISISSEIVEEYLAKFNSFDVKQKVNKRQPVRQSAKLRKTTNSTIGNDEQKQNTILPNNINDISNLTCVNINTRRQIRLRQKKQIQQNLPEKVQNIKDFLKNIRGKFNSHEKKSSNTSESKDSSELAAIISPELFTSRKSKN